MRNDETLSESITKRVKTAIRLARSARHVPATVIQVSDIPVTLTGKRVEGESDYYINLLLKLVLTPDPVPIRKIINGAPASSINPATLRNPNCLDEYVRLGKQLRDSERI
jgi:acetoacetyl-CoA synthetase